MSDKPFISVMILSYNYGEMLKKALDACKRQTFSDFEIIMINNGSTDNTEELFKKFQEENPRISTTYILINPNKGPINAWNEALKHVNGTYVMFHDADDWMEPDCLEKLAEKALETGADRVTGAYQEVAPDGTVLRVRGFARNPARVPTTMLQGTIFRYAIIEENGLYVLESAGYAYDAGFVIFFAKWESSSALLDKVIYNYYTNQKSLTLTSDFLEKVLSDEMRICSEGQKQIDNTQLQAEIEYIAIRHFFSRIMYRYIYCSCKEGKYFYFAERKLLEKYFPNYKKNKLIYSLKNGYEFSGSFACAVLCLLDRLHMMGLIALPAKVFRGSKMFRT